MRALSHGPQAEAVKAKVTRLFSHIERHGEYIANDPTARLDGVIARKMDNDNTRFINAVKHGLTIWCWYGSKKPQGGLIVEPVIFGQGDEDTLDGIMTTMGVA